MNAPVTGRADVAPANGRAGGHRPHFEMVDATGRLPAAAASWLADHAQSALTALTVAPTSEVRVRVIDDPAMAALHERYSGDPTTTDVLTFSLGEGTRVDTDLYICLDVAQRAARDHGHPAEHELLLYIVHGVLHCLGHDDHDPAAAAAMHAREDEVLTAIGVGVTYARPVRAEGGAA